VGPWNALIREGKSKVSPQPALTLGTDLSGIVEELGPALLASAVVMRSTVLPALPFCSANAEYAMASAGVIAPQSKTIKPIRIGCNAEQKRILHTSHTFNEEQKKITNEGDGYENRSDRRYRTHRIKACQQAA
jgi:hypothetical protein